MMAALAALGVGVGRTSRQGGRAAAAVASGRRPVAPTGVGRPARRLSHASSESHGGRVEPAAAIVARVTVEGMDHVGIVVDDLAAASAFFDELGFELQGEGEVDGAWVDRVVGLEGVRVQYAMVGVPDGHGRLELIKFHAPPAQGGDPDAPANTRGIRHVAFVVRDLDAVLARVQARGAELVGEVERYGNVFRLCYVRGPEGIIVELAERLG